jgi:hypothetical protein
MSKLNSWLSPELLIESTMKCTALNSLKETFNNIRMHVDDLYSQIKAHEMIDKIDWWHNISSEWWLDTDYIGIKIEPVEHFMGKAGEYANLPRERGCGHVIEKWVTENNIDGIYRDAQDAIGQVMEAN